MLEEPDYSIFPSEKHICFCAFLCQTGDSEMFPVMLSESLCHLYTLSDISFVDFVEIL